MIRQATRQVNQVKPSYDWERLRAAPDCCRLMKWTWSTAFGTVRLGNLEIGINNVRTILLVEDDSNDTLLFERAFHKAGITLPVQMVSDGDQAVSYLRGDEKYANREAYPLPSLILLDLKLPRRSGLEVL